MRPTALLCAVLLTIAAAAPTRTPVPKLIITEIQYDPLSQESDDQQTEWVEIQNVGPSPANLQGLQITSGNKAKPHDPKQRFVLGSIKLSAGARAVVGIGTTDSYGKLDLPEFAAYASESRYAWLTNGGDSIAIRDAKGVVIDEVVYETAAPWPVIGASGSSIQFIAPAGVDPAVANDDPKNWVASDSTNSDAFAEHGRGTPGEAPKAAAATTRAAKR